MRFYAYPIFIILLFSGLTNGLKAQTVPCGVYDPLVTIDLPSFFGDPCCGAFIEGYTVCYDIEAYFNEIESTWQECHELRLLGFEYPDSVYTGSHLIESAAGLASLLNSILTGVGHANLAIFEAEDSTFSVCADTIASNEFFQLTIKCGSDTIQITPTIKEINSCPVNMEVLEDAYDGILDPKPYIDMELFHIDSTVTNVGDIVLDTMVSGGSITTDSLLANFSWDIDPDSVSNLNPNALPSEDEVGHLLNAVFGSGLMSSPCMDVNINCMIQELIDFPLTSLDTSELDILYGQMPQEDIEAALTDSLQAWVDNLQANNVSPASYINSIFGWNLPDSPCEEDFGTQTGTDQRRIRNQGARTSRDPNDIRTSADEDYFSQDIPGIGADAMSPPTPSALALAKEISAGVNLYNGAQSTAIPLHTLQAYDISVPISISSTNNGLKVDDLPGSAGQHWNINAGGQITRTVKGLPDEFNDIIESAGVGQQVVYKPRIEIPSTAGLSIQFGACPTPPLAMQVRAGISFTGDLGVTSAGPISFDIRWSPFQPDKVQFLISVPIFSFFGATVSVQIGAHAGFGKSTVLMPIEYQEKALGYAHIDEGSVMSSLGLSSLDSELLEGLDDDAEKGKILRVIHPGRKRDDDAVISDHAGTWGAVRATFIEDVLKKGKVVHETKRLDLQADEFQFTAGSYSGKFFIKPDGEVFLTPYQPGVHITTDFDGEEFTSFQVQTPDGFIYTFGTYGDSSYIDRTQDMTYLLPNFYAYPEKDRFRAKFSRAKIDVSVIDGYPFFNGSPSMTPYGNTYDRNYKITNGPQYASAWHLVNIRSIKTQEEVNFEYVLREDLSYFSNKSYSHTFPDFKVVMQGTTPEARTRYFLQHNPLHSDTTRWENGRAEFTYTATQTTQDRWDLKRIIGNRGEKIIFEYSEEKPKEEIPGDLVCSQIRVVRNDLLYRGWNLEYSNTDFFTGPPPSLYCSPVINSQGGSFPVQVTGETTFSLDSLYRPRPAYTDYSTYFWLQLQVCRFTFPIRLRFPVLVDPSEITHRNAISEMGSLIEVRALARNNFLAVGALSNTPAPLPWLEFDSQQLIDILRAEGKRTFLMRIDEINQQDSLEDFITEINYHKIATIPKRFSTDQDQYGYVCDNRNSGSPFPAISYSSSLDTTFNTHSADPGMAVHYGFFNKNAASPNTIHKGKADPLLEHTLKGAILGLTLASGARISYEYESNVILVPDENDNPHEKPGAGLRVKQKVENPGDNLARNTTYSYEEPTVNTLPVHISKNEKDIYFRTVTFDNDDFGLERTDMERKVVVTSYPQNMMLPNGINLTGYGKVTERWSGIGRSKAVHYFTTPENFNAHIDMSDSLETGFNIAYQCFRHYRNKVSSLGTTTPDSCTINVESSPSVFVPDVWRQFDLLFGVEFKTETFNDSEEVVLLNENKYKTLFISKSPSGRKEYIRLFNSSMYQYNHYGSFLDLLARRAVSQFASYALSEAGVPGVVLDLIELIFENSPLAGRFVERRFETVHYDYPAIQLLMHGSNVEETYSGGGTTSSKTSINYLTGEGKESLVKNQTVVYSDSNNVQTYYHYAFQIGGLNDTMLLHLHDSTALAYLNTYDYQQPLSVETYVNGTRTQINLTALTLHDDNKIAPRANYGLQNGNLAFIGKFGGYNDDAKPTHYLLAKFGTEESNLSPFAFFDTIHLQWYSHLGLPLYTRKYLKFKTTQNFSGFYEYAGNIDHNGVATAYTYDTRGRLASTSVLNGNQITYYTYNIGLGANYIFMETDYGTGEEMDILQIIDGFGKETKRRRENDGAILNIKEYDSFWRVITERNIGTGILTKEYEASPLSKLLKTIDEENNVFEYTYKGQSSPGSILFKTNIIKDPNGHDNESNYNSLGQLIRTFNGPEESEVIYNYDELLRPAKITNPIGEDFVYDYNKMGLLWRTTVPGRGPQSVWYDRKFRPIASSDGNNQHILTKYDDFDRPQKTYLYESGFSIDSSGISNDDHSAYYLTDNLLSAVTYLTDSSTWVKHTENRLLEGGTSDTLLMVISDNNLDDIGRVIHSVTQYPDAEVETTLAHSSAGYLLSSEREIVHESDTTTVVIGDEFEHDNVLRPHIHKVLYGDKWVLANRMEYNMEDHLLIKWVGGIPMKENRFLQEVNYAYDRIGRLVRINNPGTFSCNIEKEVCDFALSLTFPLLWEDCDSVSAIKINGQVYPLSSPLDLLTQQSQIDTAIEDALHAYGLEGDVRVTFEENFEVQRVTFIVNGAQATELSLILGPCEPEQEVAFFSTCCTIETEQSDPHIPRAPDYPIVCNADLYHQLMRYDGLDIQQITIGSACGFQMRNNYEYDGLHRLTTTKNVFFGPDPYPDAFSNTYSYDKAGNIQHLMRQGIIDMGPGNTAEIDTIDLLEYVYGDSSSVLGQVNDLASNPLAQPLGVNAPLSTYGHDGNGNMTIGGPVAATYNIMNLPTKLTTSVGKRHFGYVYGGGKYSARIESDSILEETRHYLGGMEFKDGQPESYNFGDGRIVYSDSVLPRPQFRLHDHLGNTVVFFEDINQDSCITTEADTSGLELEILQRLWYYPFGMAIENISQWNTEPRQWYRYNGKERDTLSGWYEYGARWYDAGIGRFTGVDPIADQFPHVSVFNYAENSPIANIDLYGLQTFYAANGSILGQIGTSNEARYVEQGNEAIVSQSIPWANLPGGSLFLNTCMTNSYETGLTNEELNLRATLSTIRTTEGHGTPLKYNTQYGGGSFDGYEKHPNKKVTRWGHTSTAAGAYQFLTKTWKAHAEELDLQGFYPKNQDRAAISEINTVDKGLELIFSGQYEQALEKLHGKWTSLPGGKHEWIDNVNDLFLWYRALELRGNSIIATPQGELFPNPEQCPDN